MCFIVIQLFIPLFIGDTVMKYHGYYDDNDLISIGVPENDIKAARESEARFNKSLQEFLEIDWSAELKERQRDKSRIKREIDKLKKSLWDTDKKTGKRIGWGADLERMTSEYKSIIKDIIYPPDDDHEIDDWDMVTHNLSRMKRGIRKVKSIIAHINMCIETKQRELWQTLDRIDYAKDAKSDISRIHKWSDMQSSGFTSGEIITACRGPRSAPRPMLRPDGERYNSKR